MLKTFETKSTTTTKRERNKNDWLLMTNNEFAMIRTLISNGTVVKILTTK